MTISRLVSPRVLLPQRQYIAAIVPVFDPAGEFLWTGAALNVDVLPTFFSWPFCTAEEGDFETLATALKLRKAGDLGKADLRYHRPAVDVDVTIQARGAITSLQPDLSRLQPEQMSDVEDSMLCAPSSHCLGTSIQPSSRSPSGGNFSPL